MIIGQVFERLGHYGYDIGEGLAFPIPFERLSMSTSPGQDYPYIITRTGLQQ